jgi:hypothetical protein
MNNWKDNLKEEDGDFVTNFTSSVYNCSIDVRFIDCPEGPTKFKSNFLDEIIQKEQEWLNTCYPQLLKDYQEIYKIVKEGTLMESIPAEQLAEWYPDNVDLSNIKSMLTPVEIYISTSSEKERGNFGIGFNCTWDVEHGAGIAFEAWKIVESGGMEVAFV